MVETTPKPSNDGRGMFIASYLLPAFDGLSGGMLL